DGWLRFLILVKLKRFQEAEKHFETIKATRLPLFLKTWMPDVLDNTPLKHLDEPFCSHQLALDPVHIKFLKSRADRHFEQGRYVDARKDARAVLLIHPNDPEMNCLKLQLNFREGNYAAVANIDGSWLKSAPAPIRELKALACRHQKM